jgi:hypothetical protein
MTVCQEALGRIFFTLHTVTSRAIQGLSGWVNGLVLMYYNLTTFDKADPVITRPR